MIITESNIGSCHLDSHGIIVLCAKKNQESIQQLPLKETGETKKNSRQNAAPLSTTRYNS